MRYKIFLSAIVGSMFAASAGAETLDYKSCSMGGGSNFVADMPFLQPLIGVIFRYDGAVEATGDARAVVRCDENEVLETNVFEIQKYTSASGSVSSQLFVSFEQTDLPKGEDYSIVVAAGSIAREGDAAVSNPEIVMPFFVPENLNGYIYSIKGIYSGNKLSGVSFDVCADVD